MRQILNKLINNIRVTDIDLAIVLFDICEENHSHCDLDCSVFKKHGKVPVKRGRCKCFKDGVAMLDDLRNRK
jgi:hypothetical protein